MKRKKANIEPPPRLPPIKILVTDGDRQSFDAIFHTLTTPYTGRWHVRAFYNEVLCLESSGGQQELRMYFNDSAGGES